MQKFANCRNGNYWNNTNNISKITQQTKPKPVSFTSFCKIDSGQFNKLIALSLRIFGNNASAMMFKITDNGKDGRMNACEYFLVRCNIKVPLLQNAHLLRKIAALGLAGTIGAIFLLTVWSTAWAAPRPVPGYISRLPEDEVTYFMLLDRFANGDTSNDRGQLSGSRLQTGFDPTSKGYYQGGDIRGLINRLDYVQGLGATALWLAPIFKNKPVQGPAGDESAAYHGYWITDFTTVDPHFGSEADFRELVNAAHARGMKVYIDIITNHTADVIYSQECVGQNDCPYRSLGDYPIRAYTPLVPPAEANIKKPAWLNNPVYYHNRGNSNWHGESGLYGDFSGLDDVATEDPLVVRGFIDIYKSWIDRFAIDGFRIDTVKHVNPEFWQVFVPAIRRHAQSKGIPNFQIFAEAYVDGVNPGGLAVFTHRDGLPSVLDFSFQSAIRNVLSRNQSIENFEFLYAGDVLYKGGANAALRVQTFTGNHDMGRLAMQIRKDNPNMAAAEVLERVKLANAIMMFARGAPVLYSGDEQGFTGDGGDQDARETLFGSRVAVYNDNLLLGSDRTTAVDNYDTNHPLYRQIAQMAQIRSAHPALRRGKQKLRAMGFSNRILAISRFEPTTNREYLLLFNTSAQTQNMNIEVEATSRSFQTLLGDCQTNVAAGHVVQVRLERFAYAICRANN